MCDATETLLRDTLAVAVPLWIEQLRPLTWKQRQQRAAVCAQHVAEHGDLILYRSKKAGETAEAFNRLAEGVACLAFALGGVTCFGSHYEAEVVDPDPDGWLRGLNRTLWRRIRRHVER
jgi:hypothetical protein